MATSPSAGAPAPGKRPAKRRVETRAQSRPETSDVLVSAVISTYLLTHLHHVLQRAEFGAQQEGRTTQAANYAQLRKLLCLDARSMEPPGSGGELGDHRAA